MIAGTEPTTLLDQWRHRFGGRRRRHRRPRPLAALGYLAHGPVMHGLVEIEKLLLVILHDAPIGHGQQMLRLAGFGAARVPWGIKWGGPEQSKFLKNLQLQPVPGGPGLRLSATSTDLLQLGLQLDRDLERQVRHPAIPVRQKLRLPCLWAGFTPAQAVNISGDGPELAAYCRRTGKSADHVMRHICREYYGLVLYPFCWVSHRSQDVVAVFADMARFPRRQVFSLTDPHQDLVGFDGVAEFDFVRNRFNQKQRTRQSVRSAVTCVSP